MASLTINSPNIKYTEESIIADYVYRTTKVKRDGAHIIAEPVEINYKFKTERKVPRLGVMIVGLGGNNGTTVVAGVIANRENITWSTKEGLHQPNYYGSILMSSTVRIGCDESGVDVYAPTNSLLPMVHPNDIVFGGWDINDADLATAMERAKVLDYDLQRQLIPYMKEIKPLPSIYYADFIAANQSDRANNVISGNSKKAHLEHLRKDIREFKERTKVDKIVVIWSANTERFCDIVPGLNDTGDNLLAAIDRNEEEISPSTIFAVASILEGVTFINGSPQNTFVPGALDLAIRHNVYVGGDDFKTGQTKLKSVLVDFLISAGMKPVSIVSYNHLGNNDGKNLQAPKQVILSELWMNIPHKYLWEVTAQ